MRSVSGVGRVAAIGAVIAAVVLVAIVLFGGFSNDYTVTARFLNAGQLVKGNPVQTGGAPIGSGQENKETAENGRPRHRHLSESSAPALLLVVLSRFAGGENCGIVVGEKGVDPVVAVS